MKKLLFILSILISSTSFAQEESKPSRFSHELRFKNASNFVFDVGDSAFIGSIYDLTHLYEYQINHRLSIGAGYGISYLDHENSEQRTKEFQIPFFITNKVLLAKPASFFNYIRYEFGVAPRLSTKYDHKSRDIKNEDYENSDFSYSPHFGAALGFRVSDSLKKARLRFEIGYMFRKNAYHGEQENNYLTATLQFKLAN